MRQLIMKRLERLDSKKDALGMLEREDEQDCSRDERKTKSFAVRWHNQVLWTVRSKYLKSHSGSAENLGIVLGSLNPSQRKFQEIEEIKRPICKEQCPGFVFCAAQGKQQQQCRRKPACPRSSTSLYFFVSELSHSKGCVKYP